MINSCTFEDFLFLQEILLVNIRTVTKPLSCFRTYLTRSPSEFTVQKIRKAWIPLEMPLEGDRRPRWFFSTPCTMAGET